MAKLDSVDVDIELTGDAKRVVEISEATRRLGRLEVAVPEGYKALREAPDDELRTRVDWVFSQLFRLMK